MSVNNNEGNDFLRWEVKPVWYIRFPSTLVGGEQATFQIFGVDRGGLDIVRNWDKIHSVEQFNQGFVAKPEDFTFTIAVKERGNSFERLRRLAKGGVMFDVEVDLIRLSDQPYGNRPEEHTDDPNYAPWMQGFEKYKGCIINREGQTVELATFPVREFECEFLRHVIMEDLSGEFNTSPLEEGDGTFPAIDDLSL